MKFCWKCHKMVIVKAINSVSDLDKRCCCDSDMVIYRNGNTASSLIAYASNLRSNPIRKKAMKTIKEGMCVETDNIDKGFTFEVRIPKVVVGVINSY